MIFGSEHEVYSLAHALLHPSPSAVFPSSQDSPDSTTLFPQVFAASQVSGVSVVSHTLLVQLASPVAHGAVLLHVDPFSTLQVSLQPSPFVVFPSSHHSPVLSVPFPHSCSASILRST